MAPGLLESEHGCRLAERGTQGSGLKAGVRQSFGGGGIMAPRKSKMRNEFTAIVERDGKWFVAYSPEVPGANGQGMTKPAAIKSLSAAIALILEDRREDALRGLPKGAVQEMVTVG